MGEEVQANDYEAVVSAGDEERVLEWEDGLPSSDDLTPLSQPLIPPDLASAFSITPEPRRSMLDVNRASQNTLSSIRGQSQVFSSNNFKSMPSFNGERSRDHLVVEGDESNPANSTKDGSDARKIRRLESTDEDADSALRTDNSNDDQSARTLKRPRLVWTPQLHKRFVDVVTHLGIKNAVPKTIMQLMNVEGLTRENVASHLQKYRLYLKRMQGFSTEGPSSSDHLFASTPVPQSLHESGSHGQANGHSYAQGHMPLPMPYGAHMMPIPVPVLGVAHGQSHMGMPVANPPAAAYHGFNSHPFSMFRDQQGDWSGNNFSSVVSHPHVNPSNK